MALTARSSSASAPQSSIGIDTNTGPRGGSDAQVDGARERAGHVLRARRLVAPLDVRLRPDHRIPICQVRLDRDVGAHLLAGGDHQRRLVGLGVEDPADGVADARRRVQVDVGGTAGRLREAVGHPHDRQLLQPEDVGEVVGEVGQHRQLGRARVAEDRRHPVRTEQLERRFADCRHLVVRLLVAVATGPYSSDSTSAAARSPERTAPSMYPFQYVDVSVPAQWIRPTGWRIWEP